MTLVVSGDFNSSKSEYRFGENDMNFGEFDVPFVGKGGEMLEGDYIVLVEELPAIEGKLDRILSNIDTDSYNMMDIL